MPLECSKVLACISRLSLAKAAFRSTTMRVADTVSKLALAGKAPSLVENVTVVVLIPSVTVIEGKVVVAPPSAEVTNTISPF